MNGDHERLLSLTTTVIAAYVRNHLTSIEALPVLIAGVYQALGEVKPDVSAYAHRTADPDQLTCLECGSTLKVLKRHLMAVHGLTPDAYRAKWSLPPEYPMVAPDYANLRSTMAKQSGLGHGRRGRTSYRSRPKSKSRSRG